MFIKTLIDKYTKENPQYKKPLGKIQSELGHVPPSRLSEKLILKLAKQERWSESTKRLYFIILKQCFNWAFNQKMIRINPIQNLKIPAGERRENLISQNQVNWVNENCDSDFVRLFNLLLFTGRRPSEICSIKTADIQKDLVYLKQHKNKKRTGQSDMVYLSKSALEQIDWNSEFITGKKWNEKGWQRAFSQLPFSCVAYDLRHTYITNKLLAGVPVPVLATMVGNSPTILLKYYSKVSQSNQIRQFV
ncbi:site-specific tyrosine recombinase XerD [Polystyrenella longa]|uniref:Site-specific tyrosine recombinase XerD n=1 Tax=Polystyrenella longa TaxID=2528007 RepID=A0A518CQS4_9PLAN|nr:site-specific integrase [Polystyrenella longa]QDU81579.1 site-specific tyrosine recombinase XerD [Polystyrenella longa]